MTLTLDQLNAASEGQALAWLDGVYEHSPWIAQAALAARPFTSLPQLKRALVVAVREAGREAQLTLVRAHPELAGKAMVSQSLTAESSNEQDKAGLKHCTPEDFARLQQLNADYNAKFGWPFILAVRGPRGEGLSRAQIIETFARRLQGHPDFELAECLRNIHRIAEIRLNDKFGISPTLGNLIWDWAEELAAHTDPGYRELGRLVRLPARTADEPGGRDQRAGARQIGRSWLAPGAAQQPPQRRAAGDGPDVQARACLCRRCGFRARCARQARCAAFTAYTHRRCRQPDPAILRRTW